MNLSPGGFLLFLFSLFPALDYCIHVCRTKLKFLSNMFKALAGLAPPFPPVSFFTPFPFCYFAHSTQLMHKPVLQSPNHPIPSPHFCFLLDLFPLILLGSGCFLISTSFQTLSFCPVPLEKYSVPFSKIIFIFTMPMVTVLI